MYWKKCGRKQSWPDLRYYFGIFLEELKRTMKNLSQDGLPVVRELNLRPPHDIKFHLAEKCY
jgi:hypothetical protein